MPESSIDCICEAADELVGLPNDFDSLIDMIGDAAASN